MAHDTGNARKAVGDVAPKLAELTDDVLFGDVWERPGLSKRDRSLITCAALVALGKTEQMGFHFPYALLTCERSGKPAWRSWPRRGPATPSCTRCSGAQLRAGSGNVCGAAALRRPG